MRKILYIMHFKGRISPAALDSHSLRTRGSATSCTMTTTVQSSGVNGDFQASPGDLAFLDSELRVTGVDSFREDGTIFFGDDTEHVLRFTTIRDGHIAAGPEPGTMAGTATCSIGGGSGQFAAASGFINSTFTVTDSGELNDFQSGLIFIPEEAVAF